MDGKKPLEGKLFDLPSPVPEGEIQQEGANCCIDQLHRDLIFQVSELNGPKIQIVSKVKEGAVSKVNKKENRRVHKKCAKT